MLDREMKGKIDSISQVFASLSFQQFFGGRELQVDGISYKRKFTPQSVDDMKSMVWFLKKIQLCDGGILTMLLPECHANQATWSEIDKDLFDGVRPIILELVRSVGCQAAKALSLSDNLTWTDDGSPAFKPDYLRAHNSLYTRQLLVDGMAPIVD